MARPNRGRSIGSERALAKRIAWEREKRDMSYDGLAARMTSAGCAIQGSALYKIEKGDPPRRITVDELVALAGVFEVDVPDLLLPLEAALHAEVAEVAEAERAAWASLFDAIEAVRGARRRHMELYKRAIEDGDEHLVAAFSSWQGGQVNSTPAKPGALSRIVEEEKSRRANWSDEDWAANARGLRVEEAAAELVDVIYATVGEELGADENLVG